MNNKRTFFVVLAPCGCWHTSIHNAPDYAKEIGEATRKAVKDGHEFKIVTAEEWQALNERGKTCDHGRAKA